MNQTGWLIIGLAGKTYDGYFVIELVKRARSVNEFKQAGRWAGGLGLRKNI
jgi:hypothetical protein